MKKIDKKKAIKLIKEFEKAHSLYSQSVTGHWKKNWREKLKYANLKDGCWYWKGYNMHFLY